MLIGFIAVGKSGFNTALAYDLSKKAYTLLNNSKDLECVGSPELIDSDQQARKIALDFGCKSLDALIVFCGTFSNGGLIMELVENLHVPVILWAIPEPQSSSKLELNSLCCVNLFSSILKGLNKQYRYIYGNPDDTHTWESLENILRVLKVIKQLRKARIGLIGYRAPGFHATGVDEIKLKKIVGPKVHHVSLSELVETINDNERQSKIKAEGFNFNNLPDNFHHYKKIYAGFRQIIDRYCLDAIAVKCWPEFPKLTGCVACGSLSLLIDEGIIAGCEGDINGTVTMLMQYYLAKTAPFFADLISLDNNKNTIKIWHCGAAARSLAKKQEDIKFSTHYVRKAGITVEFPLKTGPVTMARLSNKENTYRLISLEGEIIDSNSHIKGNSGFVRFKEVNAKTLIDSIIYNGIEHHFSFIYGKYETDIKEIGKLLGLDIDFPIV